MKTYEEVRSVAKDGDIVFLTVNRRDYLSRLTSWFTTSPFTHAAFVFWYNERLLMVESTTHGGIRIVLASTYSDRTWDILPAVKPWMDIETTALARSGTAKYGWVSATYIGIREWMFKHCGVKLPVNRNNRNKACSEFVCEVLGVDDTDVSPGHLHDLITSGMLL
jgi:hypothetical protein